MKTLSSWKQEVRLFYAGFYQIFICTIIIVSLFDFMLRIPESTIPAGINLGSILTLSIIIYAISEFVNKAKNKNDNPKNYSNYLSSSIHLARIVSRYYHLAKFTSAAVLANWIIVFFTNFITNSAEESSILFRR